MNQRITNEKRVIPEGVKMICKTHNKLFYTNEEIERHTKRALKTYSRILLWWRKNNSEKKGSLCYMWTNL